MKQTFPKQYGYLSNANRAIKNYEKKHGKQNFVINQIDDGCYEVEICKSPALDTWIEGVDLLQD